ncbi:MAG: sulfatase-like hydrolase/transferase [Gemmatimonadetes bacterium]|nr:sulfatase-like hydrolase/transferase [Gemmatimonadota bacterium]
MARPNLLYIHSDQHSPFVMGCGGDKIVSTPHLDRLAAEGVTLDACYCPSPVCVPSRMATLAGRYPSDNQVWTNSHMLDSAIPTLAHAMGAGGYSPTLIGRMHAVGPDQLHGYVERLVGDHGPNQLGGRGADHGDLSGTAGPARVSLTKSGAGQSAYQVHDEDVTVATVDWLNRHGVQRRAGQTDEPFSLSVGFMLPHQPFVARAEDYARYAGRISMPRTPEPFSPHLHPHLRAWREGCQITEVPDEEVLRARAAYWGLVDRMDQLIGQILEALERNDLLDNTLILYTSDHGEQVGEHGLWWKQTFYEDSARVPAILWWPGQLPAGTRSARVCSSLDLNATLLEALDCPSLPASRGRPMLNLLRNEPQALSAWEDIAFSEFCLDRAGAAGPVGEAGIYQRMIRHADWKLNYYHGQPAQLFNLREDPRETTDRVNDPACAQIVAELTGRVLDGWDPEAISTRMAELRQDREILASWGRQTQPADAYRWDLRPEMDYLDPMNPNDQELPT